VKKIIDLHHGTIDIFSKKGLGTKVVVAFPIEEKDLQAIR
jgi:signal transduction histidine kinase